MEPAPNEQKSAGPVLGAIIIVALLAFGGFYYWGEHKSAVTSSENGAGGQI